MTGQLLNSELVRPARAKELEYVGGKDMLELRPIEECRRHTGKPPVTVRWVDVNKGDDVNPNIMSRLVARQIGQAVEEAIFDPPPPLAVGRRPRSASVPSSPSTGPAHTELHAAPRPRAQRDDCRGTFP